LRNNKLDFFIVWEQCHRVPTADFWVKEHAVSSDKMTVQLLEQK